MKSIVINRLLELIIYIAFLSSSFTIAQEGTAINGKVMDDEGNPLSFVNVFLLDSFDGAMSDKDGIFSFSTSQKGEITLVASIIGYKKYHLPVNTDTLNEEFFTIKLIRTTLETDEIIVTASSYGTAEENGVVMTGMDIITTPGGAADIFQSLKTLPGVTQVSESAELYVRGGDPAETITLIDQASLYHPYTYESAYGGLFSNINTSTIKGIYFSSGGFSAKYGNALSGVLELETKNEPEARSFSLGLSLASAELTAQIPVISHELGFRINARQSFTEPIFWLNGGIDEFTVLPVSSDVNAIVSYKISETGRIKLFGSLAKDNEGVYVKLPGYTDEFTGTSNSSIINIQFSEILFGNSVLKSSLSNTGYKSKWRLGILDLTRKDNSWKLRSDVESVIRASIKLFTGFEVEHRDAGYTGVVPEEDFDLRSDANGEIINSSFDVTRYGAYAEIEISSLLGIRNFYSIAGLRTDYVAPLSLNWIDPRVSVGYKLIDGLTFNFGWGIFHQHPDPRLYSQLDGNPNLTEMRADHYIVSLDYKINKQNTFRIEAYYKDYSNLPLDNKNLNYSNKGNGYAKGIDIMLKGNVLGRIDGWISYGLISTKRMWMDFDNFTSSSFDITHNFTLVATYRITQSLMAGINYKFATGRPFTPVIRSIYIPELNIYKPVDGKTNSERLPSYQRLDLRVTYLVQLFEKYFTVFYVEGINIFDINNIFGYNYNKNYSKRISVDSYFGRRTVVIGMQITI